MTNHSRVSKKTLRENEMANIVYDTIMGNTKYRQFSGLLNDVENEFVGKNRIYFVHKGKEYNIKITESENK